MSLEKIVEDETIRQPYKISHSNLPRMLDIRATVRQSVALPYSYLEMVQYDPSIGLLLTFAVCEVRKRHAKRLLDRVTTAAAS